MLVRVLGSAAGGGSPQWNCSCTNCNRLRSGTFPGQARSQAQLAVSFNRTEWFLINASPDLRAQIESFSALHPGSSPLRNTPIQGIVLTSAEVDAALGLLLLRESQPLTVYATDAVRSLLMDDNAIFAVLRRQPDQVRWQSLVPGESVPLSTRDGQPSGITCTPISTGAAFPGHVPPQRALALDAAGAVIGLFLEQDGRQIAFFPSVQSIAPAWLERMAHCDAIFIDGTFWSDDELIRLQGHGKTACQMGHQPVGGQHGTLQALAKFHGPRKIFIHINNTNPMLDEGSDEHRAVRDAGWELAYDGMELSL